MMALPATLASSVSGAWGSCTRQPPSTPGSSATTRALSSCPASRWSLLQGATTTPGTTRVSSRQWHLPAAAAASAGGGGGAGSTRSPGGGSGGGGGGSGDAAGSSGSDNTPHPLRVWTWVYAALLAAGGLAGYLKAGSTKSLSSAGGAALILTLSARTMVGPGAKGSLAVCLALSLLLAVIMCGRYQRSRKLMPAGLTGGVSLAMAAAYTASLFG